MIPLFGASHCLKQSRNSRLTGGNTALEKCQALVSGLANVINWQSYRFYSFPKSISATKADALWSSKEALYGYSANATRSCEDHRFGGPRLTGDNSWRSRGAIDREPAIRSLFMSNVVQITRNNTEEHQATKREVSVETQLPWFQFYVGDTLRRTEDMNAAEFGAYVSLLMFYWNHCRLLGKTCPALLALTSTHGVP
jgi:hypothetical protein